MKTANSQKMKVLLVDSDYDFLKILSLFLEKEGFQVITAGDGEEGLNKALVEYPDLVILEPMLSKLHGFTLCSKITTEFKKKIPVIVISKHHEEEHFRTEAIQAHGASVYLTRPIMKDELRKVIHDVLNNRSEEVTGASPEAFPNPDIASETEAEESRKEVSAQIPSDGEEIGEIAPERKKFFDWEMLLSEESVAAISQEIKAAKTDTHENETTVKNQKTVGLKGFSLNSIREKLHSAIEKEEISSENYQERSIPVKTQAALGSSDSDGDKNVEPEKEPSTVQPAACGNNGKDPVQIDRIDEMLTKIMLEFGLSPTKAAPGAKQAR